MEVEWARITASTVVVADRDQAWLYELDPFDAAGPFAQPMTGPGSVETTRRLLDAAVGAAQRMVIGDEPKPPLTPVRYAWQLVGHYHTMGPTTPLMDEAAERFLAVGRTDLAEFARQTAHQEKGHDRLAVLDLEDLGYDTKALLPALCPPTAAALVEFFTRCIRVPEPVEAFGFMYAGERTCVCIGRDYVERVQAMLPRGINATRALRVHSALGVEVEHVGDSLEIIARLPARDRTRIARAAYERTLVTFKPPEGGYPREAELEQWMSKFRLLSHHAKEN